MSPHLHYTIARAQEQEIAARVGRTDDAQALHASAGHFRRGGKFRIVRAVAAVGVCAAVGTALAATGAPASTPHANHGTDVSAQRFVNEIRSFERKGFLQSSCTINGTELENPNTGQVVTVSLRAGSSRAG